MSDTPISRRSLFTGAAVTAGAAIAGFVAARSSWLAKKAPAGGAGGSGYASSGSGSGYGSGSSSGGASGSSSGGASGSGAGSTGSSTAGTLLAQADQVPTGGGIVLTSQKIVLTRDSKGNVHGFSAVCTHAGCTVGSVDGGKIICPCHGSEFSAWTGAVVNGPATSPLPAVPVSIQGTGIYG